MPRDLCPTKRCRSLMFTITINFVCDILRLCRHLRLFCLSFVVVVCFSRVDARFCRRRTCRAMFVCVVVIIIVIVPSFTLTYLHYCHVCPSCCSVVAVYDVEQLKALRIQFEATPEAQLYGLNDVEQPSSSNLAAVRSPRASSSTPRASTTATITTTTTSGLAKSASFTLKQVKPSSLQHGTSGNGNNDVFVFAFETINVIPYCFVCPVPVFAKKAKSSGREDGGGKSKSSRSKRKKEEAEKAASQQSPTATTTIVSPRSGRGSILTSPREHSNHHHHHHHNHHQQQQPEVNDDGNVDGGDDIDGDSDDAAAISDDWQPNHAVIRFVSFVVSSSHIRSMAVGFFFAVTFSEILCFIFTAMCNRKFNREKQSATCNER